MTNKEAIEQLDAMIAEYLAKNDPGELTRRLKEKFGQLTQAGIPEDLKKSIKSLEEELNKASGVNLTYMSEKKGGKSLKKLDPKTKLRGNLIDKIESGDIGAGSMGSSGMNLTPQNVQSGLGKPSTIGAPMESERGKNVNKTKKSELNKMSPDDSAPIPMSASEKDPRLVSRLKKCLVRKTLAAAENPDEKSDASLGEKVEKLVEGHFKDNKEAERKEGHKLVYKGEKGVHPKLDPKESYKHRGVSLAGYLTRYNKKSKDLGGIAKEHHKDVLQDLKNMPKPNLPKSENFDAERKRRLGENQDILGNKKGVTSAGVYVRAAKENKEYAKNPKASSPSIHREMARDYTKDAKKEHQKKLNTIQSQPKPNLPKSEKHISDKDPVLGSHPIPKPASKDYEKKSKAYLESKPIKKAADQCRRIFEHLQKKAIEGVPPSSEPKDMTQPTKRAIREPADKPFKIQPHREGQANKPVQKAELKKKHVGFKAVEEKAREEGARDPGGVAYAVGEKKYGKKGMAEKAAAGKKKATKKSENLDKVYSSKAQERWAHTKNGEKALGSKKEVHEWDEASKGKKLPERVKKD